MRVKGSGFLSVAFAGLAPRSAACEFDGSRSAATFPTRLSLMAILADIPLGDHKLHTGQMCGLVGSEIEDRPGDVLGGGELVGG